MILFFCIIENVARLPDSGQKASGNNLFKYPRVAYARRFIAYYTGET